MRDGELAYRCLDAAQLLKHLLGVHSALEARSLSGPVRLVLLYWRPSDPGRHAHLFDLLETEIADFAAQVDDQPVLVTGRSTCSLLAEWSHPPNPEWLSAHAASLRQRYDQPLDQLAGGQPTAPRRSVSFGDWAESWLKLARYSEPDVSDLESRLEDVCCLWRTVVPPGWERPVDARLIHPERRYLRTHASGQPKCGSEHELENEILGPDPAEVPTYCFGARLIDGINAVPLTQDHAGRRTGNVEADMLLLIEHEGEHRLLLVEAKITSNNAWYAAVESLRQLKLFNLSDAAQRIFEQRQPHLAHPLPVTAVVLAPRSFFEAPGARQRAVGPARALLDTMTNLFGIDAQLATWNPADRTIATLAHIA